MNAPKYAALRKMSKDELVAAYDQHTPNTTVHTGFLLEEIYRRDREDHDQHLMQISREIRRMTIIITVLTVVIAILTSVMAFT